MRGLDWDDPSRIQSWEELIDRIDEIGFLPLFKNEIDGFSAEENTSDLYWWSGNPEQDPWEWRELIARSGRVAYGKFFGKKAGFISKEWFPHFSIAITGVLWMLYGEELATALFNACAMPSWMLPFCLFGAAEIFTRVLGEVLFTYE